LASFSGVAWAWSQQPDLIKMITSWDNALLENNLELEKTPTRIHYPTAEVPPQSNEAEYFSGDENIRAAFDPGQKITWGYGVPIHQPSLMWFKLLLLDDEDMQQDIRQAEYLEAARARISSRLSPTT
jgi:hypothetical protein